MSKETRAGHHLWPRSIRWRLQWWLAFLLIWVLTGFGIAVYERQRVNRFDQIDVELGVRVAALSRVVRDYYRDGPRPMRGPGHPDRHRQHEGPPPDRPPPHGPRRGAMPGKINELPLSSEASALLGGVGTAYYFLVWYRDGTVLKRSDNAPADVTVPRRFERDTLAFSNAASISGSGALFGSRRVRACGALYSGGFAGDAEPRLGAAGGRRQRARFGARSGLVVDYASHSSD